MSALHPAPATACGRFFCGRLALGRHRYRSCQPQPTASKPAPAKEMASRTLAWPPEKTENGEASVGAKTPPSRGRRSRGQARKPRQHWGNGQKKIPTDEGWDFGCRGLPNNRPKALLMLAFMRWGLFDTPKSTPVLFGSQVGKPNQGPVARQVRLSARVPVF